MIQRKASTYRLYPNAEQRLTLACIAGACRVVYNLALEQRRDWWQRYKAVTGRSISYESQCKELTALRKDVDWLREAPIHPLQQALRDLDGAYKRFFLGISGYPSPRKKGKHDSFRFPDPATFRIEHTDKKKGGEKKGGEKKGGEKKGGEKKGGEKKGRIKLPKLGWIKFRGGREIPGEIRNVTISLRAGQWFASVQWKKEVPDPVPSTLPPVGIDVGVAVFAALSNGQTVAPKNCGKKAQRALRKAQRSVSRKKKGSNNRRKAVRRVQRLHARVANARKDFLHKLSATIAKNHGTVVVEKLKVRNMTASASGSIEAPGRNVRQKAGLNRSILDQAWRLFFTILGYKLVERGARLIEVNPAYTSQTCSVCGCVDSANRASQARFACVICKHTENADINAAKNILRRADSSFKPVEGYRA